MLKGDVMSRSTILSHWYCSWNPTIPRSAVLSSKEGMLGCIDVALPLRSFEQTAHLFRAGYTTCRIKRLGIRNVLCPQSL